MTDQDIIILRHMLRFLHALGPAGAEAATIQEQAELAAGLPLTTAEKDLAIQTLQTRNWIGSYRVPATGRIRFYLTSPGSIALAGM